MDYSEILKNARECSGPYCKACPVCNGMACRTQVPGPGGKGTAATMLRNYQKWQEVCINMDTICENAPIDTTFTMFGRTFAAPIFAAPVGAMKLHYGDKYDDLTYNDILVSSCAQAGIAAFTGDGTNPAVMEGALHAIAASGGAGIPTVKPWNMETVFAKLDAVRQADPMAVAMDIDAAGLPFLKGLTSPAGSKTVEELRQIIDYAKKPFIIKGIMTVSGAQKALEAGSVLSLGEKSSASAIWMTKNAVARYPSSTARISSCRCRVPRSVGASGKRQWPSCSRVTPFTSTKCCPSRQKSSRD